MALSQRALDLLLSAVRMREVREELRVAFEEATSIGTSELENLAVTNEKLGNSAVDSVKLATDAVTNTKLANGAVNSAKLDQSILKIADITITAAEMLAIFTTPKTLVAAPGPGLAIAVEAIYSTITFNTAAYAVGAGETLNIQYTGGTVVAALTEAYIESAANARNYVPATTTTVSPAVNTALDAKMSATNPTLGNSPVKIRVIYRIVPEAL